MCSAFGVGISPDAVVASAVTDLGIGAPRVFRCGAAESADFDKSGGCKSLL
jgi:hypothetical protein